MKLTYDPDADAVYLRLGETAIVDSETVAPGIVVDYDQHEKLVGIEVLSVSARVSKLDTEHMLLETLSAARAVPQSVREPSESYGEEGGGS